MGSNESPLGPSPKAMEAMCAAVSGQNRYPPFFDTEFREALAETIGHGFGPEFFVTGNGACDILSMIARAYLNSDTECIICRPTFPVYEYTARLQGASVKYVDLDPETFAYDVETVIGSTTERTRLIYICSPNNPTGTLMPAAAMGELLKSVPPQVTVVADEVYGHFVSNEAHVNSLAHISTGEDIIVLHSFSKAFGLAGARLGYGVAKPDIIERLTQFRLPYHINRVSYQAAPAALQDDEHLQATVRLVIDGREWLYGELVRVGLRVWPSEGNFLLFRTEYAAVDVAQRLERRGVVVRSMEEFYLPNNLRVTVGLPDANRRFVAALCEVLADLAA